MAKSKVEEFKNILRKHVQIQLFYPLGMHFIWFVFSHKIKERTYFEGSCCTTLIRFMRSFKNDNCNHIIFMRRYLLLVPTVEIRLAAYTMIVKDIDRLYSIVRSDSSLIQSSDVISFYNVLEQSCYFCHCQ